MIRQSAPEPIRISQRFRLTLEASILDLEADAASDERIIPLLENADQRRRQQLLVSSQLERAYRLRLLLERTVVRPDSDPSLTQVKSRY